MKTTLPLLALTATLMLPAGLHAQTAGSKMTTAAQYFLASLDDAQRKKAVMDYNDPLRANWDYWPMKDRKGVVYRSMNDDQRTKAKTLLRAAMSEQGFRKAEQAMLSEAVINHYEKNPDRRDPLKFYWTIFGKPDAKGTWGLSVEGHHLSVNFVVEEGRLISSTPVFYGTNPDIIPANSGGFLPAGTRILAAEQDLAFELLGSLSEDQKKIAIVAKKSPNDMNEKNKAQTPLSAPTGLGGDKLNPEQQKTLMKLVNTYFGNLNEEYAGPNLGRAVKAGASSLHFAWAGGTEKTIGHSYTVYGKDFLIVYYNTQGGADGSKPGHAHAVIRTIGKDFNLGKK